MTDLSKEDMAVRHKPVPPTPPPCRLECSFCGYSAPKPDYKHTCWAGICLAAALTTPVLLMLGYSIFKLVPLIFN